MKSLFTLGCLLLLAVQLKAEPAEIEAALRRLSRVKRVIGGKPINTDKWPWLASLDGQFCSGWWIFKSCSHTYCGASVINKRWVLTAAHCLSHRQAKEPRNWHVKVGEEKMDQSLGARIKGWFDRKSGNPYAYQKLHGERVIIHEQYKGPVDMWKHDIALIKLEADLPVDRRNDIGPVDLPDKAVGQSWPADGDACVMKGWGCTDKGGPVSDVARAVELKKVSDRECKNTWGYRFPDFSESRMCAGRMLPDNQQGICKGDSGGPLVCKKNGKWVQAGIASFTSATNPGGKPGCFTRVSHYASWIADKIRRY